MSTAAHMLRPYMLRRWRALAGAGAATGVLTAAELAKPWPLALLVDHLLGHRTTPFTLDGGDVRLLAGVTALVLAIAIAEAAAQYASDLWLQAAGERITHDLRVSVYEHLQRLSLGFHQQRQKGDLLTRVTGDVNAMGDLFSQSLGAIVEAGLLSAGMTIVLLILDPVLALVALSTSPVVAGISLVYRRRVRSQARLRRAQEGTIASIASEALSAMPVIKAFGSERFESDRVREGSERRLAAGVEVARLQARFDGLVGVVRAFSTALVLIVGALRVAHGAISPGELLVFASYTRKAQSPMRSLAREATKVSAAMAKADRIADLLATDDVLVERPGAYHGGRAAGAVELEDVSFSYGGDRPALDRASLKVAAGERVALMGSSGAGKSTIGALIARFYDPQAGRVLVDGRDARDCSLEWLRAQVAIVLQDTVLFSGTVHDNIAYATDATREQVVAAARLAAAHDFIAELPAGYDTELGPQGVGLSGGQRQRIGIARTLLRNPPILVLDEPTTGLDARNEEAVLEGLRALMRGRTTIMFTHSARLASTADRVLDVERGRVVGERGRARGGRAPALSDPVLPLARLLDPDAMHPALSRSLREGSAIDELSIQRVVYKPGEIVAVHYGVLVDGRRHDAVATTIRGKDLAARARKGRYAELARKVNGRAPGGPVSYDEPTGALLTWLPMDPELPALAEAEDELLRRLRAAGAADADEQPVLIGYKPRARAVLRAGAHVLKAYGSPRQFEAALTGLTTASRLGSLATAPYESALPELRLTVQRTVTGERAASAAEVAGAAGGLLAALQQARVEALAPVSAEYHLSAAARKAAVIAAVLPHLQPRLDDLLRRLGSATPRDLALAPAHGDFHVDQLLIDGDGITIVDFDTMCLAAPALDVATYAADVVRGRDGDSRAVGEVLEALLGGYGAPPPALEWHLSAAVLGRAAHPFQRQLPEWPARVEAMVACAEASLA